MAPSQTVDLLDKRHCRAILSITEESSHRQPDNDRLAADCRVGQATVVATMHAP